MKNILVSTALFGLGALSITNAVAAIDGAVWQMWDNTTPYACNLAPGGTSTSMGNAYGCAATESADPSMTVGAWSTTNSGAKFAEASVRRWNWTSTANTPVTIAGQTTGFDYGVVNAKGETSPQHALDNSGYTDVMSLHFTEAIALTSVSIGWYSTDADISILRYIGDDASAPNISGKTVSQLTQSGGGWELVGHYANLQNDTVAPARTADIKNAGYSSWWLISAFNAGYGSGTTNYGGSVYTPGSCSSGLSCGNDYLKVLQVAGNYVSDDYKTPEPGSLALFGAGLLGMMTLRRRRTA